MTDAHCDDRKRIAMMQDHIDRLLADRAARTG